jgi:sporulation protein YlmC with PRC-barrel domain
MLEIPLNAEVECADGSCGRSVTVIVNPTTQEITHIVVQDKTFPRGIERLVPIAEVARASSEKIHLECTKDELLQMEVFAETEYIPSDIAPGQPVAPSYDLPYVVPMETVVIPVEVERIPPGELVVRRGTMVEATDGFIGKVGEFVVEEESGHVTHLVLQEGHLWDKKQITLPLSAIDVIQEDTIYLNLDRKAVDQLPAMHIARRYKRGDG